jgi:hypothetical protein
LRNPKTRLALIVLDGFLGLTAAWGALLVVPALPPSLLRWGPFTHFTIPAVGLGAVAGLSLAAAAGVALRPRLGAVASLVAGAAIVVFELVEAATVGSLLATPPSMPAQGYVALWLQPFYGLVGLLLVGLGVWLLRQLSFELPRSSSNPALQA